MAQLSRSMLLICGALVSLASASRNAPASGSGLFRSERDKSLRHPALRVINHSPDVLVVHWRGASERKVLAPPRENTRTLLVAGVYRYALQRAGRVVGSGRVRLQPGYRYVLEVTP